MIVQGHPGLQLKRRSLIGLSWIALVSCSCSAGQLGGTSRKTPSPAEAGGEPISTEDPNADAQASDASAVEQTEAGAPDPRSDAALGTPIDGSSVVSDAGAAPDAGTNSDASELDRLCTPGVELQLEDTGPKGQIFLDVVGDDPAAYIQEIGREVCRILYRKPEEVRDATFLTLIIRDDPGVAWKAGDGSEITVMLSSRHLHEVRDSGRNVAAEVRGVLFHEMTHMYQQDDSDGGGVPSGLIEGIADFVRARAGYVDPATRRRGGEWDDGYKRTAWFLVWIDDMRPDFVYRLNGSMDSRDGKAWTEQAFEDLTGSTVRELWRAYQASL